MKKLLLCLTILLICGNSCSNKYPVKVICPEKIINDEPVWIKPGIFPWDAVKDKSKVMEYNIKYNNKMLQIISRLVYMYELFGVKETPLMKWFYKYMEKVNKK